MLPHVWPASELKQSHATEESVHGTEGEKAMHRHANGGRRHARNMQWVGMWWKRKRPCKAVHNHAMGERPSRGMQKERGEGHKRHAMECRGEGEGQGWGKWAHMAKNVKHEHILEGGVGKATHRHVVEEEKVTRNHAMEVERGHIATAQVVCMP